MERDKETFLSVIEANKGIVYKVANSYCRDTENRKDLVQEIILQLWLAFPKYDAQYRISTWMYTIALNVSISFYRKESRRSAINHGLPEEVIFLNDEQPVHSEHAELALLQQYIRELKPLDKAIILLFLEGNTQQEIGDVLGLTATNVSTRVYRIKRHLQQRFATVKK